MMEIFDEQKKEEINDYCFYKIDSENLNLNTIEDNFEEIKEVNQNQKENNNQERLHLNDDINNFEDNVEHAEIRSENVDQELQEHNEIENVNNSRRYNLRNRLTINRPEYLDDYMLFSQCYEPLTYTQAINCDEANKWQEAMQEEIQALNKNKTWVLVPPPYGATILKNRWVFKLKNGADGISTKHKARLVVKGYQQKAGLDYGEIFSPVARYDSIRTIIAIAAQYNLCLKQFDVKTAFLNGELQEKVYMFQPEGFEDNTNKVCQLVKSLYGLK